MKRILFPLFLVLSLAGFSQTTYYWVGGTAVTSFTSNSNWNTALDASGTFRSAAAANDILIIDGSNVGGGSPTTGIVTATVASNSLGQLKLVNNASVVFQRPAGGGTGTITMGGANGDDLVIETGSSLSISIATAEGSIVILLSPGVTGRISGTVLLANSAHRIVSQTTGGLVFTPTASASTNTTNYPFGSSSSTPATIEKSVVFESGSHLYYNGGNSPMGNSSTFSTIDFRPNSNYHLRAAAGTGSFLNSKFFGNIFIENNTSFITDGPTTRIENFTVASGSTFTMHTSGSTVIVGNLQVDGTISLPVAASTNIFVMAGNSSQLISGSGSMTIPSLTIANGANVSLTRNITVGNAVNVYGKLNLNGSQISGGASFTSRVSNSAPAVTGNLVSGSYQITNISAAVSGITGLRISGNGIPSNTTAVAFSTTNSTINLSQPITLTGNTVALTFSSDTSTLATSHANGFDTLTGSIIVAGTKTFQNGTNYIVNATTNWPLATSTNVPAIPIEAGFVEINAPVTTNRSLRVYQHLSVNGKITLRPVDSIYVFAGASIDGNFNGSNYIVTPFNASTGDQAKVLYDGISNATTLPIGSLNYYLPVTINPSSTSNFKVFVFEGITNTGTVTGTPLTPAQKQSVVDAVWNVARITGSGSANVQLSWNSALEGSTFTTLPGSDIGIITNTGSAWSLPAGAGDNSANTVTASLNSFGSLSAGAVPPSQPFIFNPLPIKTYGNNDFNGGATSLNATQPIIYTSNNPAVATIVAGNIHITGAGTADITASQASDGFYPAVSVTQTLTVQKAPLSITANNMIKFEGQPNPTLTVSYSGFVLGETSTVLLTPVVISTTAVTASPPGTYPITPSSATAANYSITFVNGVLTVQARQNQVITFNALPVKTYGNANFSAGATSDNNTIPITYTSSNVSVATVTGSVIHIVGAGSTVITASQAGNAGWFPAVDVSRTLTVNKAPLTIRVRDTTRVKGEPNPLFTVTYTGFVLGETSANLSTLPNVTTTAVIASPPGYYPITAEGAVSSNYAFTYVQGRLTVLPSSGTGIAFLNAFMPEKSVLTVRVYSPEPALGDILLINLSGHVVLKRNLFMPAGFINSNIDVSALPSGIYILAIRGDKVNLEKTVPIIK